jgi:hypothetical protein
VSSVPSGFEISVNEPVDRGRPPAQNTGECAGDHVLARTLAQVARQLQDETGLEHMLHAVVASAVDTIPGAAGHRAGVRLGS